MLLMLELVMGSSRMGTQDSSKYVSKSPRPNRSATSFAKNTAQHAQFLKEGDTLGHLHDMCSCPNLKLSWRGPGGESRLSSASDTVDEVLWQVVSTREHCLSCAYSTPVGEDCSIVTGVPPSISHYRIRSPTGRVGENGLGKFWVPHQQ